MRINLPCNTPTEIVQCIHESLQNEKLLTPEFPQTTSIHLSEPPWIVTFTGKGCYSVASQRLFRVVNNLLSQQPES